MIEGLSKIQVKRGPNFKKQIFGLEKKKKIRKRSGQVKFNISYFEPGRAWPGFKK